MLGDLEGSPTPIEVKIFGDDTAVLETLAEPVEEMLEKVDGVVDVVGMQRGNPEVDLDDRSRGRRPRRAHRRAGVGAAVGGVARRGGRRICGCSTGACPCACGCPTRCASTRRGWPTRCCARRPGRWCRCRAWRQAERSNGQAELLRENLRGMALVSGRLEGRDLGSAVAEIRTALQAPEAAGRLHLRDRRAVRVAAHRLSRAAGRVRRRRRAGVHDPGRSSSARGRRRC